MAGAVVVRVVKAAVAVQAEVEVKEDRDNATPVVLAIIEPVKSAGIPVPFAVEVRVERAATAEMAAPEAVVAEAVVRSKSSHSACSAARQPSLPTVRMVPMADLEMAAIPVQAGLTTFIPRPVMPILIPVPLPTQALVEGVVEEHAGEQGDQAAAEAMAVAAEVVPEER